MKRAGLAVALLACASLAEAAPIWETYPKVLCRAGSTLFCSEDQSQCEYVKSKAVFSFDFRTGNASELGSTTTGTIQDKIYHPSADESQILLSWGEMATFFKPRKATRRSETTDEIPAVKETAFLGTTSNVFMTCHPD